MPKEVFPVTWLLTSRVHPSRHDVHEQLVVEKKCSVDSVTQSAGFSSNCMNMVVKAGSIMNGTRKRNANKLNVPSSTKKAVV